MSDRRFRRSVARQAGVGPGMVFAWRKQLRAQLGLPETPAAKSFAPVMLAAAVGVGPKSLI